MERSTEDRELIEKTVERLTREPRCSNPFRVEEDLLKQVWICMAPKGHFGPCHTSYVEKDGTVTSLKWPPEGLLQAIEILEPEPW